MSISMIMAVVAYRAEPAPWMKRQAREQPVVRHQGAAERARCQDKRPGDDSRPPAQHIGDLSGWNIDNCAGDCKASYDKPNHHDVYSELSRV